MKPIIVGIAMLLLSASSTGAEDADCLAAGGTFRSGIVTSGPTFEDGQVRNGVELSHTHVALLTDQDGRTYDIAIDNVFASGFVPGEKAPPAPLNSIRQNDRIEVCGAPYPNGFGMHWVHINCGRPPTPTTPDGWLKSIDKNGVPSTNYENNTRYCSIFNVLEANNLAPAYLY